ncbi:MAG: Sir2 family NAD-dependent protein deacetylase [Terrimesophilobacter sp.]
MVDTIDDALHVLRGRRIAVLTGAGVSTDSGIPDYRSEGKIPATPMSFAQFLESEENRRRYWAGSHVGWRRFAAAEPNEGHRALERLERAGIVNGIITQNVDGLHRGAGSRRVIELHGTTNAVVCLRCSQHFSREAIAQGLEETGPRFTRETPVVLRPDGDVETDNYLDFRVPECSNCGGMLKPAVVFFGEFVPRQRFHAAFNVVREAEAFLVAGSSLTVNSGIRLLDRAIRQGLPVVIVNRGATKGDARATVRLEGGTSQILGQLAQRL